MDRSEKSGAFDGGWSTSAGVYGSGSGIIDLREDDRVGIYLIQDGGLVEMNEQQYDSEDLLQELLAQYPSLLAGGQIDSDEPRRWLLVTREAPLPDDHDAAGRWSVDHLFLDQDAIPTLVEVKRSSDTRVRREVVGQMLDYAANAVMYWPVESIRAAFESRCSGENGDPAGVLAEFLRSAQEPEAFWQQVKTNLQAGKVRLLFVADEIPRELQRTVTVGVFPRSLSHTPSATPCGPGSRGARSPRHPSGS